MNIRSRQLARRREQLVALIGSQRNDLNYHFQSLRVPLHVLDRGREIAMYVRRHIPAFSVGLSVLLFLSRRRVVRGARRASSLGGKIGRWWGIGRMVLAMLPRVRRLF